MLTTPSLLSRSEMIISLKTIQYLHETCKPLLNDYEKELLRDFVISLAGSMVKLQDGRIIISLCSGTVDAITELHEQTELYAVIDAACYRKPGALASSNWEPLSNPQLHTLQDTFPKNTHEPATQMAATLPLPACHSDRELD